MEVIKDGLNRAGFIAQEVTSSIRQAFNDYLDFNGTGPKSPDGTTRHFIRTCLFLPLVKAVQELSAKVTALEAG